MNGITPELRQRFLDGMSYAACTVNVVTTDGPAGRAGVTVSAMASVSADTPQPTLLVCVHHLSLAAAAILANGVFCVNILRDDQSFISDSLAGRSCRPGEDKFACATWTTEVTGAPRITDPLVAFDCRLMSSERVGTHHVFIGSVEHVFIAGSGSPLIYANRAYGTPARLENSFLATETATEMLRIGSFHTFAPYVIPTVLERLAKAGRAAAMRLLEGDQRRVLEALRAGEVEIGLLFDFGLGEDIESERLCAMEPYVLLPEGHRLGRSPTVALGDLVEEPLVLLDTPPGDRYFLSLFEAQGLVPRIGIRTRSFEMVRSLVGHGLGYSVLATKPAPNITCDGRALMTRPLDREASSLSYVVLARIRHRKVSEVATAFASECRNFFGQWCATTDFGHR
jgi:flavin reductase (DIM6/NTAB) family NADH-FMN oxidoreductase RutF